MKMRIKNLNKMTKLILVGAALIALAFISNAIAAPGPAPTGSHQAQPMAPLPNLPCTLSGNLRTCHLWASQGTKLMPDGLTLDIWGFGENDLSPSVPGPVIRANVGETLEVVLHNEIIGESVGLNFPGQEMVPDLDGVSTGSVMTYTLELNQAGSFLYEAGLTPGGSRQVAMGLFGPLLIGPPVVDFDQELVMVFSEIDPDFNSDPLNFSMANFKPQYWFINGFAYPDTGIINVASNTTILLRYLNAGVEYHSIGILGLNQEVIAVDGEMLASPHGAATEPLSPGETKEALINIPAASNGTLYPLFNTSLHHHNNNQRLSDGRVAFGGMLTFLQITGTTSPVITGPSVSNLSIDPEVTNGEENVTLSAIFIANSSIVKNNYVVNFEYFIDVPGMPGTGTIIPIIPAGSPITINHVFTPADLSTWSSGEHNIFIRGQDVFGNWGPLGSASLYLDNTGPSLYGMEMNPNPTNGAMDVFLRASGDDRQSGNSDITGIEFSLDSGTNWLTATLNITGAPVAEGTITIPAADILALGEGLVEVQVRAEDEWGNFTSPVGVIDLALDMTGPTVLNMNLVPNLIDFSFPLPSTFVRLTATIEDQASAAVLSNVDNGEGFINVQGDPGTGFDLFPTNGLFDETIEDVYYNIPINHFATLLPGDHQILVVGKDNAGNWGLAGSATINLQSIAANEITIPAITGLKAEQVQGTDQKNLALNATASGLGSEIAGAVWFLGTDPTSAEFHQMDAADGSFGSMTEAVETVIDISGWAPGTYQISVAAVDENGNWGAFETIEVVIDEATTPTRRIRPAPPGRRFPNR